MNAALSLSGEKQIALIGNPNSGKTALFNALTGLRFTTANYPGVTVQKRTGKFTGPFGKTWTLLDLPGTYGLIPRSLDEQVAHDVLFGLQKNTPSPSLIILVVDANNLERNLYLATQIIEAGFHALVAVNMWDLAEKNGLRINIAGLEKNLGVPCVKTIATTGQGVAELKTKIDEMMHQDFKNAHPRFKLDLPVTIERELENIEQEINWTNPDTPSGRRVEALRVLSTLETGAEFTRSKISGSLHSHLQSARKHISDAGLDWSSLESEARYAQIEAICKKTVSRVTPHSETFSEKLDRFLMHKIFGLFFFMGFMGVVFQSIFTWAQGPMDLISTGVDWLGSSVSAVLPESLLESLLVDGIIAGVGNVIVFLPQIFLLFFFIGLAEDFGYMARAAFVLDRVMKKAGLNGKAFLPLLSSFACAIPGIMATRTIEDRNERMAAILAAPFMSCSARIPVYALMIGAFIPAVPVFWGVDLKGVTLFSMYFLSLFAGLSVALIFRKTLLKGSKTPFVFELPPYRLPNMRTVLIGMWDRGKEFIQRAGTIIFAISIILWFLSSFPRDAKITERYAAEKTAASSLLSGPELETRIEEIEKAEAGDNMRHSYAGRMGHMLEPVVKPLGFDWKIGVGLVASFAAREVLVSTLAIVYNVGKDADEKSTDLISALQNEKDPVTGKSLYTPLTAVSLMVFFVLACQCMSTLAIVKRETNSWRWPIFMFAYMSLLAYGGSFLVYQGGKLLGFS